MQTRRMSNDLQRTVEELAARVEEQNLQISALLEARQPLVVSNRDIFNRTSIPDPIKLITTYAGETENLSKWIASVDQKLEFCKKLISDPTIMEKTLPLWLGIIRDKIVGEANEVLIRNGVELDWGAIKAALKEELGDKRDLATLSSKIAKLKQGNRDVTLFYNECKKLMVDINSNLLANDETKTCAKIFMNNYEAMITNAFIDGLSDNLSYLIRIYRPKNLQDAYKGALEQMQSQVRKKEHNKPTELYNKPMFKFNTNQQQRTQFNQFNNTPTFRPQGNPFNNATTSKPPYKQINNTPNSIPTFHNKANYNNWRPQLNQPNPLYPMLKQEPASQQTRTSYKPNHVNMHETIPINTDQYSQQQEEAYQPQNLEQNIEQNLDNGESSEELNFCTDPGQQFQE